MSEGRVLLVALHKHLRDRVKHLGHHHKAECLTEVADMIAEVLIEQEPDSDQLTPDETRWLSYD